MQLLAWGGSRPALVEKGNIASLSLQVRVQVSGQAVAVTRGDVAAVLGGL